MAISIAIYSRKSKFTGVGESIENQFELCRQYIEKQYSTEAPFEILYYEDEGFSGKNTSRPQFKKMLKDAKKKRFSVLVCYRLDRISRNVGDFANLIEDLNGLGIDFVSIKEGFDTSNPIGRAMMYIASVFAQLERETIAERIRDNMYELSKTGRWLGGTTPTGYASQSMEKVSLDGKLRKTYKLQILPEEAQLITMIYDKFLEMGSLTNLDAFLVQHNYKTKNNIHFTRFSIRSILTNPVYMIADDDAYRYITENEMSLFSDQKAFDGKHGIMAYNRTLQRDGMAHQARSMSEWIITVGKHEGLITGYQWIKVQMLLNRNKSKAYKKPRSNSALLSGLLYCADCGNYMRPKLTRRYTSHGERGYDYLCTMKEKSKSGCCNMKNADGNLMDTLVIEEIGKIPMDNHVFSDRMGLLYKTILDQKKEQYANKARLLKLLYDNEKEANALVQTLARLSESSAEPYVIKQIEECHEKSVEIKKQIKVVEDLASQTFLVTEELHILQKMIMSFETCFQHATLEQKRSAIRSLVQKVVWDGSKVQLYLLDNQAVFFAPQCEDSK